MKHAYFLVLPKMHLLDLAGPLQMVATLKELGIGDVAVECIGPRNTVQTFQSAMLSEVRPLPVRLRRGAALFVIGSKLDEALLASSAWRDTVTWLRMHATPTETELHIVGICTGAFLIAEAGLLNGRLCTTHHRFVPQFRQRFPASHILENRVYVRDGKVWTSAGVTSGTDMTLHLIADAFGHDAAIQIARENVVHFRRFGSDPELGAQLRYRSHSNQLVHAIQDVVAKDLSGSATYNDLAKISGFSGRHLARLFVAETGITMKRFQTELRMELARRLLADSTLSLEQIVERCGFGSVQAFRAHWNKREKLPPSTLRRRHATLA